MGRGRGNGSKAGQAIPLDFMAGVFVFLVMLAYFLILWDIFAVRFVEHAQTIDDELAAISVADRLVLSGGYPTNWTLEPLSAQSIGLASRPHELDPYRVSALSSMANGSYASVKSALGIDRNFQVKIEAADDGARLATIGQEPANATRVVEVTRLAMLNGEIVNVRVQVYES